MKNITSRLSVSTAALALAAGTALTFAPSVSAQEEGESSSPLTSAEWAYDVLPREVSLPLITGSGEG